MGDPIWYEVHNQTGRNASWHGEPDIGNLLFLDGSVRKMRIRPGTEAGPAVYEPLLTADAMPERSDREVTERER